MCGFDFPQVSLRPAVSRNAIWRIGTIPNLDSAVAVFRSSCKNGAERKLLRHSVFAGDTVARRQAPFHRTITASHADAVFHAA
jgi:hypothetical protein